MTTSIKVLSVLPVVGDSKDSKRISMLQAAGFNVEAVAFERDCPNCRPPGCAVESLGRISHGQYVRRVFKMFAALTKLRRAIRRNEAIYASGPDMALMALMAGVGLGKPLFVEVADLREIQVSSSLKGKIVRAIEKWVINSSALLIVTAPGFLEEYYRSRLKTKTPAFVLENKLEASQPVPADVKMPRHDTDLFRLRIGYFGVLRCEWSWEVLETLAKRHPDRIEVVVAGYQLCSVDIAARAKKLSNVRFLGPFRSPEDLPALYRDVDLVWGCYPGRDTQDQGWRRAQAICRSNRFYESCRFRTPLISVADSGDGIEVKRHGIGCLIENQEVDAVVDAISKIRPDELQRWSENICKLPRNVYEYTTEVQDLGFAVRGSVAA